MNRKSKKKDIENTPYFASEELYQALFEQAADGIFIADEQGHCIEVNQRGCTMLGYTREELLGVSMDDLVMAEDLARDPLQLDAMRAGTILLKERRFHCKDGRFLPVEISARMLADGRFLAIVRDISKRRQAEAQLRESNERFRLLAESSLTGIYLIQDNRFRYVNSAMARLFGYEVEEIIDQLGPMSLIYEDDRPLVAENLRRRIEGEEEAIRYEFRGLRKDGSAIDIEVHGRRIEYSGKTGVIGTLVDITERKRADKALQRSREAELQFSEQLATLQEVTNQLSKAESSDDLIRQAIQLGRSRLGFDRVSIWFIEESLGIMRGSFGTDEYGELRDERNAQVTFRREGLAWRVFSHKESTALVEYGSLRDHLGQEIGEGDNAVAALWDGDDVIGVISVDNLFTHQPIRERRLEILRLYATTLGHLITRKRAEEALRASETRFRTLVDHAADAFFLHDEKGTILDVNSQACEYLGYSREELIGLPAHAFDAGLDRSFIHQLESRLNTGEVVAFETRHRRKDGSAFPVEVRGRPFWQGERRFSVSLARDISERKKAEEAYRASVSRFRELFNKAAIPLCFTSKEGGTLHVNAHFEKTFGYLNDEIPTLNEWWPLAYPDPVYREWVIDTCNVALQRAIDTGSDVEPIEYEVTCKNGDIRTMVVYGSFIGDELLLTFFDITERKHAEQERQAHLRFLESLDQVNRTIQGTYDLEQTMSDVLDVVLDIFGCDRSNLIYPCDPEAATWQASMERTRPEYSSILELGQAVPVDSEVAELFRISLMSSGPVRFGPQSEYPLLSNAEEEYGIKSFLGMVLYPKVGSPWLFGLHQCSYTRVWTPEEERLFQEIGRRLADGLTSLLAHRHLQESEERYRLIAENTADTISVFDLNLKSIYVSPSVHNLRGYTVEEAMAQSLDQVLTPESLQKANEILTEQMALEASGKADPARTIVLELEQYRKDGSIIWVELVASAIRDKDLQPTGILTVSRDITERKQADEALRASEARFRIFVDHAADAFYLHDAKGTILDVNRHACESLGYSREELVGMSPNDFDVGFDRSLFDQMEARLDAGEVIAFDTRHQRKDGTVFPVEVRVRPFWQGKVRFSVSLARDITERKRADEALRASEERYRALYRDNPSMFFTLDSDGMIISVNAFGASQLGYTIDELEGQSVLKVFYEEDRTAVTTHLQNCLQNSGQIDTWQFRKVRKDGSLLWVEEFARTVTDPNGAINILVVCQDITDRKQAETEQKRLLVQIREQAQQVQYIIDTVPEGVILLGKDQFVTLTNPVAAQFLDLLASGWENGRLTRLGKRPLPELLTSPPKGLWHEITSDDDALVFEAIARPVEHSPENGGWVLVLRDITQERDIQRRVQQQNRLAAVGQLAAGIAHDFNNILAVISLYAQLIARTVEMPKRTQEQIHTIEQQINRATDLIQQILDFSRQSLLDRQPLDLLPFIEKLVALLKRTLPEHIRIEFDYAADAYFIQADPTRMQQVMMNLAVNARDAMPEGGHLKFGLTHVQTEASKPMMIQELPPGDWIQIKVADTGEGISPEALSNIFEPFYTTKKVGEGTGLGLAQVYGIVQQHEGTIDVVTEVGQGTTFFLYFPALDTGKNSAVTPDRSELQLGQGQRVLLVEDNPTTREALLESLILLNYDVFVAKNGREALTTLATKADEIDLVLSDVVMPEVGGIALFHAMQQKNLSVPVVLLTGHPLNKEMENLQTLGLAGWLTKPPDLVVMSHLLAQILSII